MTEAERSIVNQEHFKEVFELKTPKYPQALKSALNRDYPDDLAWKGIQIPLVYVIPEYQPDNTSHSTTSSKNRKRVRGLEHQSEGKFKRSVLRRMFLDSRRAYFDTLYGRANRDTVSNLFLRSNVLIRDMPLGAQDAHREIFTKVFLGGFFKGLGTGF